jgi:predicted Zn-dependent protease
LNQFRSHFANLPLGKRKNMYRNATMSRRSRKIGALHFGVLSLLVIAYPAFAQPTNPETSIEAMIDASTSSSAALATAATQVSAGDLTGAATTLERLLINDPDATLVRLRYAALLCELDDRQAARFELSKLKSETVDVSSRAQVVTSCGPMEKPAT